MLRRGEFTERLNPVSYKFKNPFLTSKCKIGILSDYFHINPKAGKTTQDIFSFIPMGSVSGDNANISNFLEIQKKDIKGYTPFQEGDFLFAKITPCMQNGKMAIAENMPYFYGFGSTEFHIFRAKAQIHPRFLRALFLLDIFKSYAQSQFVGSAGQQRVPTSFFHELKIPTPSQNIQEKIISIMDNAYAKKAKVKIKAQQLLSSIDDYLLSELGISLSSFSGKEERFFYRKFYDITDGRLDPRFYKEKYIKFSHMLNKRKDLLSIGELAKSINSGATPTARGDSYVEGGESGVPFIRVTDITDNQIRYDGALRIKREIHEGELERSQLQRGNVLLSMAGTIGLSVVVKDAREANINQALAKIKLKNNNYDDAVYISEILNSRIGQMQTERYSRPSVQANINLSEIRAVKIPMPPRDIRMKIMKIIKESRAKAARLRAEADAELEKAKKQVEKIILGKV